MRKIFAVLLMLLSLTATAQYKENIIRLKTDSAHFIEPYTPGQVLRLDSVLYCLTHRTLVGQDLKLVLDSSWAYIIGGLSDPYYNGNRIVTRPTWPVSVNPGGVTTTEFLDNVFFPFVLATISLSGSTLKEVGTVAPISLVSHITQNHETVFDSGYIEKTSAPVDTLESWTTSTTDKTVAVTFSPTQGSPNTLTETYVAHEYTGNNGSPGPITPATATLTSCYPYLYGMSSMNLESGGSAFYNAMRKSIQNFVAYDTVHYSSLDSLRYAYFAFPDSLGTVTSIKDQNDYEWLDAFTPTVVNVSSSGLVNNWTNVSYIIYRSNNNFVTTLPFWDFEFYMNPAPFVPTAPVLSTSAITAIAITTATSGGTVSSDGGASITEKGVCWDVSPTPTTGDSHSSNGTGTAAFASSLTSLTAGTLYYVRAYATNSVNTSYGNQLSFTALDTSPVLPTLVTTVVTNIQQTTATCGGNITSDGGATVTVRGVCWNTSTSPTTSNSKTTDGTGPGMFTSSLTTMAVNTIYYVRAYATNSVGTSYGNERTFTTLANVIPLNITTTTITDIAATAATSGGHIISDGGTPITARGVCWSTSPNPIVSDSRTINGSDTGVFVSYLTDLSSNTLYHVRAFAANTFEVNYGNDITFITLDNKACPGFPTVTHGGRTYQTALIGTQCWLRENLDIGTRINGSLDQTDNATIEKYCYNDSVSNCTTYGGLYQWGEMVQYLNGADNTTNWVPAPGGNIQGICPTDWHIPTNTEWLTMFTYLGGQNIAGGKIKETGTVHWMAPNVGATNSTAFTARGGGFRWIYGGFYYLTNDFECWTATPTTEPNEAYYGGASYGINAATNGQFYKHGGLAVRCIKD